MPSKDLPSIITMRETSISKWLTLIERDVLFSDGESIETYHSVRPFDYVSILAMTRDFKIPLVKQYRPVLEKQNVELPGGLIDTNRTPEETALIELREETGLVSSSIKSLGALCPDPGRLENRLHCFFVPNAEIDPTVAIEKRIQLVWATIEDLKEMILDCRFTSSLHIALLALASLRGCIKGFEI